MLPQVHVVYVHIDNKVGHYLKILLEDLNRRWIGIYASSVSIQTIQDRFGLLPFQFIDLENI